MGFTDEQDSMPPLDALIHRGGIWIEEDSELTEFGRCRYSLKVDNVEIDHIYLHPGQKAEAFRALIVRISVVGR